MRPISRNASANPFCRGYAPRRLSINEALTVPVRTEAASRSTSSHCAVISFSSGRPANERCQSGPGRGGTEGVKFAVREVRDARGETEAQEMRQSEDMVAHAAARPYDGRQC